MRKPPAYPPPVRDLRTEGAALLGRAGVHLLPGEVLLSLYESLVINGVPGGRVLITDRRVFLVRRSDVYFLSRSMLGAVEWRGPRPSWSSAAAGLALFLCAGAIAAFSHGHGVLLAIPPAALAAAIALAALWFRAPKVVLGSARYVVGSSSDNAGVIEALFRDLVGTGEAQRGAADADAQVTHGANEHVSSRDRILHGRAPLFRGGWRPPAGDGFHGLPVEPGTRIRLIGVDFERTLRAPALYVRLSAGGGEARGVAAGPADDPVPLERSVQATLDGVARLLGKRWAVRATAVHQVTCASQATIAVELSLPGSRETLIGCCLAGSDPLTAAARATLDAINRVFH